MPWVEGVERDWAQDHPSNLGDNQALGTLRVEIEVHRGQPIASSARNWYARQGSNL